MKEASGEANMTVVTILLIGIVVAVATPIVRNMMNSTQKRSCCVNAGGEFDGTQCSGNYSVNAYNDCMSKTNDAEGSH